MPTASYVLYLRLIFQFLAEDIPHEIASKVKDYAVEGLNAVYKQRGYVLGPALLDISVPTASLTL